jgi:dihydroorotate dehydrogenase (NAD+) catalytic subunit
MLASGLMDEDAGSINRIIKSGAGAVVTKSLGIKPKKGYLNPTVVELEHGILNAIGLANPGLNDFSQDIKMISKTDVPLIASIYGTNASEFSNLAIELEKLKVDAIELNMSCPHAKGYGLEIGADPKLVENITSKVKNSVNIPVFVKLSPNLSNLVDIAKSAEKGNADAIVAINTVRAMKIDLSTKMPILANITGGYSGKAIKPIGVYCVYEISKNVDIPVIGVGGITTGEDAIEYIMAGASAIQIGSAIYYRGIQVFKDICLEMDTWMQKNHTTKLSDIIGVAHK